MTAPRSTRRGFLQGETRLRETAEGEGSPLETRSDSLLTSLVRRAMACDFEVQLAASGGEAALDHALAALDLVEALEAQMTVYRDDSEVIHINRAAAERPVPVESRLFELFQLAEKLYHATAGALDITTGPLSEAWGFSRREGRLPSEATLLAARQRVGMQHVALDAERQTIVFGRPGVSVNLNAVGKGYALDRMAELLAQHQVEDYLLHGGKSSVLARGHQPGGEVGWAVGLRHPLRPAERLAEFRLRDEALATSGSGTQFFMRRGRRYGHILDPRTGWPAEGLFSATVLAPRAAEADALSTAFYVMGVEAVEQYCAQHSDVATLLVAPGQREGDVQLFAFGLDEEQLRVALPCQFA